MRNTDERAQFTPNNSSVGKNVTASKMCKKRVLGHFTGYWYHWKHQIAIITDLKTATNLQQFLFLLF